MPLIRSLARPLLASIYIYGGLDAARNPGSKSALAENVLGSWTKNLPGQPSTEQIVRIDGLVKVAAGTTLALGRFPRLSAVLLATSIVPTTLAGHRFWAESDPTKRRTQQLQFLKNASSLGGLLLAAVDTEGKPSVRWRAAHSTPVRAVEAAAHTVEDLAAVGVHSLREHL